MRKTKSCGCVIATNLIEAEKARKKHLLAAEKISIRASSAQNKEQQTTLRAKELSLRQQASHAAKRKVAMHKKFKEYVKVNSRGK